ncbi:MAG: flavin reductase [Lentisphaeria bacterium]|nr:flavin reductase [Lentisphaeria bacterium]
MKHITQEDLFNLNKIERLNIVNSISGIKAVNLIGTRSIDGQENLAVFSSIIHLGSNPALLGFIIRPTGDVPRHTYENMSQTNAFTLNHAPAKMAMNAHYTSAKFDRKESEFEACGFTPIYKDNFQSPYVEESPIQIGLEFVEEISIKRNNTILLIGEVRHIYIQDGLVSSEGYINLETAGSLGVSGLNCYYDLSLIGEYPYARPQECPTWQ